MSLVSASHSRLGLRGDVSGNHCIRRRFALLCEHKVNVHLFLQETPFTSTNLLSEQSSRTNESIIAAKAETPTTVSAESPSIRGGAFYTKHPIASPEQFVIG
jgi:hypothetical protein